MKITLYPVKNKRQTLKETKMTKEQELAHYRKVLERIRDWALTSKASSNILRGFARKALEDVDSTQDQ